MASESDDLREDLRKKISLPSPDGVDRCYGRSAEESILMNSYYASLTLNQDSPANVILIRGDSGLGKSRLAETLRSYAKEDDGFFIRGKFDQSNYGGANLPYSGITNAFREYCCQLEQREEDRDQVVKALKKEISQNEWLLLCEAIPSLRNIIQDCDEASSGDLGFVDDPTWTKSRFHRLEYLLKKATLILTSLGDPIVFLLDDMQWSDASSLDLIKTLAGSAKNPFVFVFTYRYVPRDHPFLHFVDSLQSRHNVTEVTLHGLDSHDLYEMVSDMLGNSKCSSCCRPLSDLLCRVTNGNPLLARQQLVSLLDKELIYFDDGIITWDLKNIEESSTILKSLPSMTSDKIKRLPVYTQKALQICACIGAKIDYEVLGVLAGEICLDDESLNCLRTDTLSIGRKSILSAIQDGLLTESHNGLGVSFIHDSVQSAAYSLLQPEEQAPFHLKLGQILKSKSPPPTMWSSDHLFTVANQLARGCELVQENERIAVIHIFLRAGDESKMATAFRGAHYFYAKAIDLLCNADWIHDYRLCCDVYFNASEVALRTGDRNDAKEWLEIVSLRTRGSVMDQLKTLWAKVNFLATKGQLEDAIDLGLKDLGSLVGFKIAQKNSKARTIVAMVKTRRLMRGHTETTLLKCPRMTNEKMNAALRLLNFIALLCAAAKPRITPLVCCKIVELNMRYGISSTMPPAMAWYGVILFYSGFPISEAAKYGQIALHLQDALKCTETRAQVAHLCHGMINTFACNISDCIKPLHDGHIHGLQSGDVRHAMICAQLLGQLSFHSGRQLASVKVTLMKFSELMKEYNTTTAVLGLNMVYEQVVDKLTRRLSSSSNRVALKRSEFSICVTCTKTSIEYEHASSMQAMMAYILDDYDLAWQATEKLQCMKRPASQIFYFAAFLRGMTALALVLGPTETPAKKTSLKKAIKSSRKVIKKVSEKFPINFETMRHLMEAECATFHRSFDSAEHFFALSIENASKSGHTHFEALAWERFGRYHQMRGNLDLAYEKLRMAHKLYDKWGARVKCDLMEKKFKDMTF